MISIPKELNPTKESDAKFSKKNHSYQIYYKAILKDKNCMYENQFYKFLDKF